MHSVKEQKLIGIEIGGTKLQLVVGSLSGTIEEQLRYPVDPARGAAGIQIQVKEGLAQLAANHAIAAIGVGFGGPVDWQTGTILVSHQVQGWEHFNLKTWLGELTGKPVYVDNDANVAALGEAVQGCGKGYSHVFYITMGSGIGGGLVVNKTIYHGKLPGEVEIGHIRLDKNGNTLESNCSGWAINKKVNSYIQQHPDSELAQLAKDSNVPEAIWLKPALEKKDKAAMAIVADLADDLALALSHVVHLLHPDVIIIGGGLSLLNKYLQQPVSEKLPQYIMKAFLPPPPVEIAALGECAVPIGAMELAKAAIFSKNKGL